MFGAKTRKIQMLRRALQEVARETEAPYFDGKTANREKLHSWARIAGIAAHALRVTKR